jgi:hypothetical protein
MLRMLPVEKPEELVQVRMRDPLSGSFEPSPWFSNPLWEELRDTQDVFSGALAWSEARFDLAQGGAVRFASGIFVSGDYFTALGIRPAAGRLFATADDQRGCPAVATLSYGFWQDHFGGAQSAIVRMALGAQRASILRLAMRDVAIALIAGTAAGACLSFATVSVLQKMLFGLVPHDTFTFLAAIVVLSAVAIVAGYLPARRATRVDPMIALR